MTWQRWLLNEIYRDEIASDIAGLASIPNFCGLSANRFDRSSTSSLGSLVNSADFEETGIALIASARPTAAFGPATQLFIADHANTAPSRLLSAMAPWSTWQSLSKVW